MAWLKRLWPSSLSMRIAIILVGGLLLAQLITGTVWFESRRRHMLEIPTRVFATRVADTVRILQAQPPVERAALLNAMQAPDYALRLSTALPVAGGQTHDIAHATKLLTDVIRLHLGRNVDVRVLDAQLLDDRGAPADSWDMVAAASPTTAFRVAVRLSPDATGWLIVEGSEDENGVDLDRARTILDYIFRIYLLRIFIVVALTLIAVRQAMAPLKRMADAAEALGRNIHSPPMRTCGPREVRRAAEAFNAMQTQLVANLEERTRFLAAISHDLRSPITRLRLRTELLPREDLKVQFRRNLSEMEEMVDATLSFATSGVEDSLREEVDLDLMLALMVADYAAQGMPVTLTGVVGGTLRGFPRNLRRCVQNLIENALRYAGNADIHASGTAQQVSIVISDHGPGIPDDQIDKVFEPFYRLEISRNAASGGIGLGLSIARNIALAHDGTLRLANRPTSGLLVTLTLPRFKAPQDPPVG
jgi:signal transduction histidine kinase